MASGVHTHVRGIRGNIEIAYCCLSQSAEMTWLAYFVLQLEEHLINLEYSSFFLSFLLLFLMIIVRSPSVTSSDKQIF